MVIVSLVTTGRTICIDIGSAQQQQQPVACAKGNTEGWNLRKQTWNRKGGEVYHLPVTRFGR